MGKKIQKQVVPIIIEPHPDNYTGYPFITLIQYKHDHILTIVDNITNKKVSALVLDLCGPEQVNEQGIIDIAIDWYDMGCKYPISIEFSKRNLSPITSKLFKSFELEYVTRVIGPLPEFDMENSKVKRRRKKSIPAHLKENVPNRSKTDSIF